MLAVWLYRDTLFIGFLLDDFYHLDYLIQAQLEDPGVLTRLLWSNWSPNTTLTSYRPLVSFSLAADYALWNINAFGYHLTNLILYGGCVALVAGIAWEICLAFSVGNRGWVAAAAALLFASYPLHPEAVAWIIGRVDVLCGLLTFASTYLYLVHRRTGHKAGLIGAVALFVLAMASKEMAVTLPLILTLLEFLAPTKGRKRSLLPMWGALAVFALWRTVILGTVVGGYGATGWKAIKQGLRNFADNATLVKLIFGANEEFPVEPLFKQVVIGAFVLIDGCALMMLKMDKQIWRLYAFLILWTLCTIAPTFQIWHIWPNLVGSRLFFLGSAPLCIAFAAVAAGTVDGDRWNKTKCTGGAIAVTTLVVLWSMLLETNLIAWKGAGQRLREVQAQVFIYCPRLSPVSKLYIPTLPQDYKGAPILGRPEYLAVLCRPPFSPSDYTPLIATCEPLIAGGNEDVGPQELQRGRADSRYHLLWNNAEGRFEDYKLERALEIDPLFERLGKSPLPSPLIGLEPAPPRTLRDRQRWLEGKTLERPTVSFNCQGVPGATKARVYISKPWQPFSNAPRAVPPESRFVEKEIGPLAPVSSALIPVLQPGAHDVAVMAFDKNDQPLGIMSETVCVISKAAE